MEVKLELQGKESTFTASFISTRMLRRTLEVQEKVAQGMDLKGLDALVDYLVELFGRQFTRDDLYDGLPAHQLVSTATVCIQQVVNELNHTGDEEEKNQ
jgi:hypothetical protein